jgi:hypothetical protein
MRIPQSSCLWKFEDGASSFSNGLCLDLRVHPSECNKEYFIGLTLVRFVTPMVLQSFCLSCVCKLILAHT